MDKFKKKYSTTHLSDFSYELDELFDAIKENNYDTVENLYSAIFIYQLENEEIKKEIADLIISEDTSVQIKAKVAFELGLYYETQDEKDLAQHYFNIAINNQKKYSEGENLTLAMIYLHMDSYYDAIDEFLKCDLTNRDTLVHIADCYTKTKQFEKAIEIYTEYLKTDATKPDYYFVNEKIGWNYLYLGEYDTAEDYFIKANLINNIHLLIDLSNFYRLHDEKERTLKMYYFMFDLGEGSIIYKIEELENELRSSSI